MEWCIGENMERGAQCMERSKVHRRECRGEHRTVGPGIQRRRWQDAGVQEWRDG